MSTTETVVKIRKHFTVARTMRRNQRLGLYQGRNNGGSGHVRREELAWQLMAELPRELQGMLTSEHRLAERISENRDLGNDRPELKTRMSRLRADIKAAL